MGKFVIYYIIEHPTRGTLLENSEIGEPHFSRSNLRSSEQNWKFTQPGEAVRILNKVVINKKVRDKCQVLRSDTWEVVYPNASRDS